jgi:nicotinate-nucleotide adenylyltransferase
MGEGSAEPGDRVPTPILGAVRRGILGGTFDPPHLAHLITAEAAYRQLGLDVVTWIPAGDPWQKAGTEVTPGGHRGAMTRLASATADYFETDDRELRRPGPSYTIDTIESFDGADELVLIVGADAALGMVGWHRSSDLVGVPLAVAPRPGVEFDAVRAALGRPFEPLDMPLVDVSGTDIRDRIRTGRSARFLVITRVLDYIGENNLYRDD